MKHTNIRFEKSTYLELSKLGSAHSLSFSSHEVLGKKIIGLDGIKRRLLIAEKDDELKLCHIIDLYDISNLLIKKTYNGIKAGELENKGLEEFLESISLQFEFRNGNPGIGLPFYESGINPVQDLAFLEKKAGNWQWILLKMTSLPNKGLIKLNQDKRISSTGPMRLTREN